MVAPSPPVLAEPLVALAPLQPPEAVQALELVLLQVSVDEAPVATDVGLPVRVTAGGVAPPPAARKATTCMMYQLDGDWGAVAV